MNDEENKKVDDITFEQHCPIVLHCDNATTAGSTESVVDNATTAGTSKLVVVDANTSDIVPNKGDSQLSVVSNTLFQVATT